MDYSRAALADHLAAEYVSGSLRGPARRRFEALLPAHPTLLAAVREWQSRLMPLTVSVEPRKPPAAVWKRIEARIGGATRPPARTSWWSQLALWRGVSAFASIAAIGLAVLLASPGPAQPPVVVVLSATGAAAGAVVPASFVASISGDGRAMVTRPLVNVSLEADRALELWALPGSGAPRSLGLISASGATVVKKAKVLEGATGLAVSLEPAGGSPTGAPTGPVLYVGKLQL
ncbi:anti-sigma factor [Piscinibacter sp.]|jgi:anti-sigma-K factor RskA|uniref:anti-sigma factor n=1 Tax=Piscinibacter sp. TaxID=1903157 RepID=UPI002F3F8579